MKKKRKLQYNFTVSGFINPRLVLVLDKVFNSIVETIGSQTSPDIDISCKKIVSKKTKAKSK